MTIKWIGAHTNNYTVGRGGKNINKIVLHWIVGTLESADATFANPDRRASAHYGIGDKDIHQYAKESDTAWHASNWTVNQESIGIEHEGGWLLDDGTRQKPSDETHETSAQLVADICKRYNLPIDRNTIHVHNEYSATQCPGSLDVDRIIERAKQLNQPEPTPTPPPDVINDPQQKLDMGDPWGIMELQAVKSTVNDQYRAIDACESNCEDRVNQAVELAISENNGIWQARVDSANSIIDGLKEQLVALEKEKAENLDWRTLFSIAWKKWWNWKKSTDS